MEPVISERTLAVSSGEPIEVSRKGKAPPLERGRGKAFPTYEPDRVTAEAVKRRNDGLHLQNLRLEGKSTCAPTTIKISEETPVKITDLPRFLDSLPDFTPDYSAWPPRIPPPLLEHIPITLLMGRRISFFAYALKIKHFTGPLQNGSVNSPGRSNGNICCVPMNHFETATATEQQKGIAQKETLLPWNHNPKLHIPASLLVNVAVTANYPG